MKIILSIIETISIIAALVLGILWINKPNGPYEPIAFIALLIGTTIVEVFRRRMNKNEKVEPIKINVNSPHASNSPNAVIQNMVNSQNSLQIHSENVTFHQLNSKIKVEGEWNKIDLSNMIPPEMVSSVGLLFRNEFNTGYIKGIVRSDVEGMPGERRFDTSIHDLNPLTVNINSKYIYIKIEEVESIKHSLQLILAEAKLIR